MNITFYRNKFFLISLLLHTMIALIYYQNSYTSFDHEDIQNNMMIPVSLVTQHIISHTGIFPHAHKTQNSIEKKPTPTTYASKTISNHANALLTLLHNAIAKEQVYPESALQLQETGTVTIKLTLYPDGHIENIQIQKSSGTPILDDAAIAATQHAGIIETASDLLTKPSDFYVAVEFDL